MKFLLASLLSVCGAFPQSLSFGVVAGTNLTDGVGATEPSGVVPGPRSVVGGATIGLNVASRFSLELSGLYRGLKGRSGGQPFTDVTWEFPLLGKYRLAGQRARVAPFIEAGPSFRTTQLFDSHIGITGGAGLEVRLRSVRISPTIRYTRWESATSPFAGTTPANQAEMLVSVATVASDWAHPLGRLGMSILAGAPITEDFAPKTSPVFVCAGGATGTTCSPATEYERSGSHHALKGVSASLAVIEHVWLELDAIQRYIGTTSTILREDGSTYLTAKNTISTWQFPVLASYRMGEHGALSPFVGAGPSFRLPQMIHGGHMATYGATAAVGIRIRPPKISIAPSVRFTHWGAGDPPGVTRAIRNQVEVVVEIGLIQPRR